MKKIICVLLTFVFFTGLIAVTNFTGFAEISPTAATFTHHEHEDESKTSTRWYTRFFTTRTTTSSSDNTTGTTGTSGTSGTGTDSTKTTQTTKYSRTWHFTTKRKDTTMISNVPYVTDDSGNVLGKLDEFSTDKKGNIITKKTSPVSSDRSNESPDTAAAGNKAVAIGAVLAIMAGTGLIVCKKGKVNE